MLDMRTDIVRNSLSRLLQAGADFILNNEILLAAVCFLPLLFLPSFNPSLNIIGTIGLIIGLAPWAIRRWRLGYYTHRSAFDILIALFIFSACLGIFPAKLQIYSLARFWVLIGCVLLFYVVINILDEKVLKGYLVFIIVLGFATTLILMSQIPDMNQYAWEGELLPIVQPALVWLVQLPKAHIENVLFWNINRNSIAGVVMIILPLMWPLAHLSLHWSTRLMAILGTLFFVTALAVSGWVSVTIALFIALTLVILISGKILESFAMFLIFLLFGIIVFVFGWGSSLTHYVLANIGSRLDLWQAALYMIHDFPLTGIGLGMENWYLALPYYSLPKLSTLHLSLPCYEPEKCWLMHAHNFYLQTWAEQGVLGFVALVGIVIVSLVLGARYIKSTYGIRRAIVAGGLWSFTAYSIHNLVDSGSSSPGVVGLIATLALIVSAGQPSQIQSRYPQEDADIRSAEKKLKRDISSKSASSSVTIIGVSEWFGISLFLTLASLILMDSRQLLGVVAAVGAGLALAMATIKHHDSRNVDNSYKNIIKY
jgi:O-antigen ligase